VAQQSNLDLAINALVLIRNAQRAMDAALRLPAEDRAALAEQIDAVRRSTGKVAASLAATIPGAQSLAGAGQAAAGRPEFRALSSMVSFFARQGAEALGAVAGVAGALGGGRDRSLAMSERIVQRLEVAGVTTRDDLARELEIDPRAPDLQDAIERTLGTGRAEWYGAGTYGLPREELELMISRAREEAENAEPETPPAEAQAEAPEQPPLAESLDGAMAELDSSLDRLSGAVSARTGGENGAPKDATEPDA
jgi:hypothetical protein